MKRSKSKEKRARRESKIEAPEPVQVDKPEDGEAKTAAEPVPGTEPKKGRHPADCQCPLHAGGKAGPRAKKPKGDPSFGGMFVRGPKGYKLHPRVSKMAAIGPLMLAGAVGANFFDVLLPYPQEDVEGCQEIFEAWMDELQLNIGPGWQYGILLGITLVKGIQAAEPITPEMREALKQAKEAQRAAARAEAMKRAQAAQAAKQHANGATPTAPAPNEAPAAAQA